ncbi:nuclear transport factor 2 family protein [Rhodococcus opacus]|uniref:nuclear transport factor 2 family protein n=1 Tax=Rhodococcus opacus TaxID=37919 RepID=UPI00146B1DAB|nr:nuclear transport factor 2 family protein [Rhodococcus opacus]MDV7088983.1 nuclear transport factor 2 family protein [Rhodococcus opacus]WKN60268.1 nuclear transport factor 2 family protein [Rhodococcus opacus]
MVDFAKLSDRLDILDVFSRYALGMDLADRDLFASAWTDDAVWTCGSISLDVRGRDEILAYFDSKPGKAPKAPAEGSSVRLASNHHIVLDGDRATATAEMVGLRYTGHSVHTYSVGVYEDEFRRTGDGWRLSRRDMIVNPIVPVPNIGDKS